MDLSVIVSHVQISSINDKKVAVSKLVAISSRYQL